MGITSYYEFRDMRLNMLSKETIASWFITLQNSICESLEQVDGLGKFSEDFWQKNGSGRTRILQHGTIFEKGGVNFSEVFGKLSQQIAVKVLELPLTSITDISKLTFYATGISIVIHPNNPMVPIIHMNLRYFEMNNGSWWFGGGIDLTPHYIDLVDAAFFHNQLKLACDKHNPSYYAKFKEWADNYFFIPHRNETRGIGGIFFDRLTQSATTTKENLFAFIQEVGNLFAPTYIHLINKNKLLNYSSQQQMWQYLRRGRYVEFNLIYDRGTKFGLETNGQIESILMSLPEIASWLYNYIPEPSSPEEQTLKLLKKNIDWATQTPKQILEHYT